MVAIFDGSNPPPLPFPTELIDMDILISLAGLGTGNSIPIANNGRAAPRLEA